MLFSSRLNMDVLNIAPWLPEPIAPDNITDLQSVALAGEGLATEIALSHDESTLAIRTTMGFYLQPAQDLNAQAQFIGSPDPSTGTVVQHFEYTNDNRLLVFSASERAYTLYEWNTETQTFVALHERISPRGADLDFSMSFTHIDISPDGTQLALSYCLPGGHYIAVTSVMVSQIQCGDAGDSEIVIADISRDGIDDDAETTMLDLYLSDTPQGFMAFSADWAYMAYVEDNVIMLRDMMTDETRTVVSISSSGFRFGFNTTLTFSPDGEYLAFKGSLDGELEVWAVDDLLAVEDDPFVYRIQTDTWSSISNAEAIFHPQTNDLIVSDSNRILIRSSEDLRRLGHFDSSWRTTDIALTEDGTILYGLSQTGFLQVWSWDDRSLRDSTDRFGTNPYTEFVFSPDDNYFVNYSS
ncbi:MAG: WD40 repeat domain-containing protein, partial [Chloroflexota bacterium]